MGGQASRSITLADRAEQSAEIRQGSILRTAKADIEFPSIRFGTRIRPIPTHSPWRIRALSSRAFPQTQLDCPMSISNQSIQTRRVSIQTPMDTQLMEFTGRA